METQNPVALSVSRKPYYYAIGMVVIAAALSFLSENKRIQEITIGLAVIVVAGSALRIMVPRRIYSIEPLALVREGTVERYRDTIFVRGYRTRARSKGVYIFREENYLFYFNKQTVHLDVLDDEIIDCVLKNGQFFIPGTYDFVVEHSDEIHLVRVFVTKGTEGFSCKIAKKQYYNPEAIVEPESNRIIVVPVAA